MRTIIILLIVGILLLFLPGASLAWSDWQSLKTDYFTVFYKPGHETEAKQVLATLEYYRPQVEKLCGDRITHFPVVIDDTGILVNGFSNPLNTHIHLFRRTPGVWAGTENWWALVGVHEYTHQLSLANTGGIPGALSRVFGTNPLFMPNLIAPGWIHEGITVYSESQLSPYQGRLNDGIFDAYIGARVADQRFPSILEATYSPYEYPQREGIYNYGGEFFNFLSHTYGEEKFAQFFKENGSSLTFNIDRSAKKVFGKSFPELWKEWQEYETERFKDSRMEGERITTTGWRVESPRLIGDKLLYQRTHGVKTTAFDGFGFAEIVERNLTTGNERTIVSTTSNFVMPFKLKNGKLYYTIYEQKPGYANASYSGYGMIALLREVDLATGKERTLLKDELRSFEILQDGRIIYTKDRPAEFGSAFYLWHAATGESTLLFDTDYLVEEIAISGQRTVVVARKDWESFSIYQLDLTSKTFAPLVHTPHLECGISLQGEKLFFTANYDKKIAGYCYDFTTAQIFRLTENGLAAYPIYDETNNQLYYLGLNSAGYDIYRQDAAFREFKLPESPAAIPPVFTLSDNEITPGDYRDNLKTLAPRFWSPQIYLSSDGNKYGVYFEGGDAIMDFPSYSGTIGYNEQTEKIYSTFNLHINYFAPFQATLSYREDEERTAALNMFYPLLSRLSPGISDFGLGASLTLDPDYKGVEVKPFITTGFRYPKTQGGLELSFPQSELKTGEQRFGQYASFYVRQYLPQSELRFKTVYINDPDNPDILFAPIRGYTDELNSKEGIIYNLEYSRPLLKLRNGLWYPNVYFEDIIGTAFFDQAVPEEGAAQWSWGVELHLETKTLYNILPLDWGYRYVRNREDKTKHELFLNINF